MMPLLVSIVAIFILELSIENTGEFLDGHGGRRLNDLREIRGPRSEKHYPCSTRFRQDAGAGLLVFRSNVLVGIRGVASPGFHGQFERLQCSGQ